VPANQGIRFGYWMPVFGGWLRNVEDEQMEASWEYTRKLALRSEELGFDLSLIAELNLNDIKGVDAPSLDAWSTSAALAAVTSTLELMVAVRPTFHSPALFAKQTANIDRISNGRLALNVVSSWWEQEARMYGVDFERHDDRYGRTAEWLEVVNGAWTEKVYNHNGRYYKPENTVLEPKPVRTPRPPIYAGGESEAAKNLIAQRCDAYVMHGDSP
jgi:dimethylsulfone monooxygenase